MAKIAKHKFWEFEPLSLAGPDNRLNIIFVHELKKDFEDQKQSWRKCLLEINRAELKGASFHIFGFRAATLLRKGETRFKSLAEKIQSCIVNLWKVDPLRLFIIVGHGLAAWVVQQALASHSYFTASEQFSSIVGVILWGVPDIQTSARWATFTAQFLPKSARGQVALSFTIIVQTESNFNKLAEAEHLRPEIARPNTSVGQAIQVLSLRKRATSFLHSLPQVSTRKNVESFSFPPVDDSVTKELAETIKVQFQHHSSGKGKARIAHVEKESLAGIASQQSLLRHNKPVESPTSASLPKIEAQFIAQRISSVQGKDSAVHAQTPHQLSAVSTIYTSTDDSRFTISLGLTQRQLNKQNQYVPVEVLFNMARNAKEYSCKGQDSQAHFIYSEIWAILSREAQDHALLMKQVPRTPASFVVKVHIEMAIFSYKEGNLEAAEEAFERLEKLALKHLSEDPRKVWETRLWLSLTYHELGKYDEASKLLMDLRQSISVSQLLQNNRDLAPQLEMADAERRILLSAESLLSLVKARQGLFHEAFELSEKIISDSLIIQIAEKEEQRKRGLWAAREVLSEQQEAIFDSSIQDEGKAHHAAGERKKRAAVDFDVAPKEVATRTDGERRDAEYLQGIRSTRAQVLVLTGRRDKAERLNDDVVRDSQALLGMKHARTLESRILEIELLLAAGKLQDAENRYQDIAHRMQEIYDSSHPLTLYAYELRVMLYTAQGRWTEARNAANDLVSRSHKKLGQKHFRTIRAKSKLAMVHAARGDFSEALELQACVIKDALDVFGSSHILTLECQADLASTLCDSGDPLNAQTTAWGVFEAILRQNKLEACKTRTKEVSTVPMVPRDYTRDVLELLKTDDDLLKFEPPYVLCFNRILQCFGKFESERVHGNLDLAIEVLKYVLEFWRPDPIPEEDNLNTLACLHDLAVAEYRNHNFEMALRNFDKIFQGYVAVLGHGHQQTLLTQVERNFVRYFLDEGSHLQEQRALLAQLDELLGGSHFASVAARGEFSNMLHHMGYLDEAEELLLNVLWTQLSRHVLRHDSPEKMDSLAKLPLFASVVKSVGPDDEWGTLADHRFAFLEGISNSMAIEAVPSESRILTGVTRLVDIEWNKGNYDNAIITQKALVRLEQAWGYNSERVLEAAHDLGYMCQMHADACVKPAYRSMLYEQATNAYYMVLKELGPQNRFLRLVTQANLGAIHFREDRFDAARQLQEDMVETLRAEPELATMHTLVDSIYNLALTEKAMDNLAAARDLLHEALKISNNPNMDDSQSSKLLNKVREWGLDPSGPHSGYISQQRDSVQASDARFESFREIWALMQGQRS